MNKWFVVHSREAFQQNPRMIGFGAKAAAGGSVPATSKVKAVKPGDRIVYYYMGGCVIKGTYEVVDTCFEEEKQWPNSPHQFKIKPITELENEFDFHILVSWLDMFKDPSKWGMYLRGTHNSLKQLNDNDYSTIEKAVEQWKAIPKLTELKLDSKISIREDPELTEETVTILREAGLCPPLDRMQQMFPELITMELSFENENEESPNFPYDSSILDVLGEYRSAKKEIVIYNVTCKLAAESLNIDVKILKQIVLIHEVTHAVTHLGKDSKGRIWEHFDKSKSEDKELFAQIYPLSYFKQVGDTRAIAVFRELSKHQDARYNLWRDYQKDSIEQLNYTLLAARLKQPLKCKI